MPYHTKNKKKKNSKKKNAIAMNKKQKLKVK